MPLYNPPAASAGGSALDANGNLVLPAPTAVTTPAAGAIAERVITRAGFSQLAYGNADTADIIAMPSLENYSVCWAEPISNANMLTIGGGGTANGTSTPQTQAFTTYTNSRNLFRYFTGTTAGLSAGFWVAGPTRTRGTAARRGGFSVVIRFVPVLLTGHQGSIGIFGGSSAFTAEPSADVYPTVCLLADSTDVNWQIFSKPLSAAGTKVDTGLSKTATGSMLALYLYAAPFGSAVFYQLENEETQAVIASGSITATLPASAAFLTNVGCRVRNGATTTVAEVQINKIYSGSRY